MWLFNIILIDCYTTAHRLTYAMDFAVIIHTKLKRETKNLDQELEWMGNVLLYIYS